MGELSLVKARGAQENLWPKFILESAPLRATSSGFLFCIQRAISKPLKLRGNQGTLMRRNCQFLRKNYVTSPGARGFPKVWKSGLSVSSANLSCCSRGILSLYESGFLCLLSAVFANFVFQHLDFS